MFKVFKVIKGLQIIVNAKQQKIDKRAVEGPLRFYQ